MMRTTSRGTMTLAALAAVVGMAVTGGILASPAQAADPYNATVAGFPGNTPLVALAPSSTQTVAVTNLPPNVGLYLIHCKTPTDPRQPPVLCDSSTGAVQLVPGDAAGRAAFNVSLKLNAEFFGVNVNPTSGPVASESVDCRVPTGNPRSTTCTLYVLGSGRDSANPAYLRVWPTVFSPVKPDRKTDVATVSLAGAALAAGSTPTLKANAPTELLVTTQSRLAPTFQGDKCSVANGKITGLVATGTCTLVITTTGGKNYKPLVQTQVFNLS